MAGEARVPGQPGGGSASFLLRAQQPEGERRRPLLPQRRESGKKGRSCAPPPAQLALVAARRLAGMINRRRAARQHLRRARGRKEVGGGGQGGEGAPSASLPPPASRQSTPAREDFPSSDRRRHRVGEPSQQVLIDSLWQEGRFVLLLAREPKAEWEPGVGRASFPPPSELFVCLFFQNTYIATRHILGGSQSTIKTTSIRKENNTYRCGNQKRLKTWH